MAEQDTPAARQGQAKEFAENADSLWRITLGPLIWALHFIACYAATAVWCAKVGGAPDPVRIGIGVLTAVALAGILRVAWGSWKQWDYLDDYDYAHDAATTEDRHEFLGHAAFLLCVVSFIGTVYTALPALFAGTCA